MTGKDWLTGIIILLIIGIVLDGIRRMRQAKRENIALSKNAKKADLEPEVYVSSSEFPSGGARVATVRDPKDAEDLNENVRKSFESKRVTAGAPRKIPEQVSLNLDESVPMLMDSVEESAPEPEEDLPQEEFTQDYIAQEEEVAREEKVAPEVTSDTQSEEFNDHREPAIGNLDALDDESEPVSNAREVRQEPRSQTAEASREAENSSQEAEVNYVEPDEVLIINIMAKSGERIAGADLLQALVDEDLKFGEMDIFHRHKDKDGDGPILYSIANMVVPGTFNLAAMDEFETPGISMFLSLPVEGESLAAYNDLATTAKNLATKLGAELKDENRSVMTTQTIEHGRQRVIEYERKKKLARA